MNEINLNSKALTLVPDSNTGEDARSRQEAGRKEIQQPPPLLQKSMLRRTEMLPSSNELEKQRSAVRCRRHPKLWELDLGSDRLRSFRCARLVQLRPKTLSMT